MGRIAEALKKAQIERESARRFGSRGAALAELCEDVAAAPITLSPGRTADPRWRAGDLPAARPDIGWTVDPTVVSLVDCSSRIAEQYRAVRTWLLARTAPAERNCIAITSSVSQEGKSVTTANLATVLSEVRHLNVLAVDADLRRPGLGRLLRMGPGPGLADVLAGRVPLAGAIAQSPLPNLSFLPAGGCGNNRPTELFNSKAAERTFDEIRERYHFVLVDTPPVQRVSDIGVIGALCSGILVVVRMRRTPSALVRQSVRWLQSNNLNVIGCIATACNGRAARRADA